MYSEKIAEAVHTLVDVCKDSLNSLSMKDPMMKSKKYTPVSYCKEFKTIRAAACRRAGHSSAIPLIADYLYDGKDDVLVLFPKLGMQRYFSPYYASCRMALSTPAALDGDIKFATEIPEYSSVIVDVSQLMSAKDVDNIYRKLLPRAIEDDNFFFIFLE